MNLLVYYNKILHIKIGKRINQEIQRYKDSNSVELEMNGCMIYIIYYYR